VLQRLQLSSILDAQVFNEILQLFENPELTFGRCKERMSVVYDLLLKQALVREGGELRAEAE